MMAGWDLPPLLAQLQNLNIPIWLVASEGDRTIPPERSTAVEEELQFGQTVRVPKLGHLAHEEDPGLFDALFRKMVHHTATS